MELIMLEVGDELAWVERAAWKAEVSEDSDMVLRVLLLQRKLL